MTPYEVGEIKRGWNAKHQVHPNHESLHGSLPGFGFES